MSGAMVRGLGPRRHTNEWTTKLRKKYSCTARKFDKIRTACNTDGSYNKYKVN